MNLKPWNLHLFNPSLSFKQFITWVVGQGGNLAHKRWDSELKTSNNSRACSRLVECPLADLTGNANSRQNWLFKMLFLYYLYYFTQMLEYLFIYSTLEPKPSNTSNKPSASTVDLD